MRFIFLFMELFFRQTHTHTQCEPTKARVSEKRETSVDKFAFSFDLHNNFTKIHIKSGIRHNFGCSQKNDGKNENEKLLPNQ